MDSPQLFSHIKEKEEHAKEDCARKASIKEECVREASREEEHVREVNKEEHTREAGIKEEHIKEKSTENQKYGKISRPAFSRHNQTKSESRQSNLLFPEISSKSVYYQSNREKEVKEDMDKSFVTRVGETISAKGKDRQSNLLFPEISILAP